MNSLGLFFTFHHFFVGGGGSRLTSLDLFSGKFCEEVGCGVGSLLPDCGPFTWAKAHFRLRFIDWSTGTDRLTIPAHRTLTTRTAARA